MRITKSDAVILLDAIGDALLATYWKRDKRSRYSQPLPHDTERSLKDAEDRRDAELQRIRAEIRSQL